MNPVMEHTIRTPMASPSKAYLNADTVPWQLPVADSKSAIRAACRVVNVVAAAIALLLVAPVMLVVAILVKLSSPGPVFYTQTRVGLDRRSPNDRSHDSRRRVDYGGRLFRIYKFRTMRADPQAALQVWAGRNDSRVTPIGRVLRKYRLDELPQLVNVLKGDMNLVGPRPEQPNIFLRLHQEIAGYRDRQKVMPGITGWAQINHHYDESVEDVKRKLQYDLEYIERQHPMHDLMIMARTIPAVLMKRGGW